MKMQPCFKKTDCKKGFTLIEVLVYTVVLVIMLVTVFSSVTWAMRSSLKAKVLRETLDNAQRSMEILTYEAREAKNIYVPTTTSNQLSLETTKYPPVGESTTYIDFFLCGTKLCIKRESQDPVELTSDEVEIKSLTFTRTASGSVPAVQIDLTVEYKNPGGQPELNSSIHLTSTASLRSY